MKKRVLSLLLALAMCLSLYVPAFATPPEETNFSNIVDVYAGETVSERINVTETVLELTSCEDNIAPNITSSACINNHSIQFVLDMISEQRCSAYGKIFYNASNSTFSASGDYYVAHNTSGKTILANLVGSICNTPMTLMVSYDYSTGRAYVYASVGALAERNAPIQLEFGTFTENIYEVNAEYANILNESTNRLQQKSSAAVTASNAGAIHQSTRYISLPNGSYGAALSTYFPNSVIQSGSFKFYSKVNTYNNNLLNYIQANYDSSASGPIRVYSANITMRSNDPDMVIADSNPDSETTTVTVCIPYFWGTSLYDFTSYRVASVQLPVSYVDRTIGTTGGFDTSSNHEFYFGSLGGVASTDCGSSTPNATTNGLGVYNLMSYVGVSSSVSLSADASVVIGYVGDGARPGSRLVKSFTLGNTTATKGISIT